MQPFSKALVASLWLAAIATGYAQTVDSVLVTSGLNQPDYATYAPGDPNRLFIVEKGGDIEILNLQTGLVNDDPFLTIPTLTTTGERGLLGLAFDPGYASNGYFYVNYTDFNGNLQVSRYQAATSDSANVNSSLPIINIAHPTHDNHNGGWMGFGPDNFLYISTGDGGSGFDPPNNSQTITNQLLGKILRLDISGDDFPNNSARNYAIPGTNPFVGVTGDDEIWAYGLRNAWRNSFDSVTGDFYIADVGQTEWEELNFQLANSAGGQNYGWRVMEGNHPTGLNGQQPGSTLIAPIHEYPNPEVGGRSITGGYVYRGSGIPGLQGTYFFADFITGQVWSFRYVNGVMSEFTEHTSELAPNIGEIDNIVSFGEDANGNLYIVDFDGDVFRVIPEPSTYAMFGIGAALLIARLARRKRS